MNLASLATKLRMVVARPPDPSPLEAAAQRAAVAARRELGPGYAIRVMRNADRITMSVTRPRSLPRGARMAANPEAVLAAHVDREVAIARAQILNAERARLQ